MQPTYPGVQRQRQNEKSQPELDQHAGDEVPDLDKTSLSKSVRFFEKDFLHPMMRAWGRARRDDAEYAAALKGDF